VFWQKGVQRHPASFSGDILPSQVALPHLKSAFATVSRFLSRKGVFAVQQDQRCLFSLFETAASAARFKKGGRF
jgi:hypothetical protein